MMIKRISNKIKMVKVTEWLLFLLFLASFLWGIVYIFSDYMLANVNSDTTSGLLKLREMINEKALIPQNWCYANTKDFPLFAVILAIAGFFADSNILTLQIYKCIMYVFFIVSGYVFSRRVLHLPPKYTFLLLTIWLCPFSSQYLQYIFMDGYGTKIGEWFLLIWCGYYCIDDKFNINVKRLIVFTIVQFLFYTGDVRWLAMFVVPYFVSLIWVWFSENYKDNFKDGIKKIMPVAILLASTVIVLILGIFYQKIAYKNVIFSTGYTGASLLNLKKESMGEHFNFLVSEILNGMGYANSVKQISLFGIISLGIIVCTVLLLIVLPFLLTKKYETLDNGIKRIIVFYWITWLVEVLTIIFSVNALGFRHVLYTILLGIGLSLYYVVHVIFSKLNMMSVLFAVAVGCYIALNWVHVPVNSNSSEIVDAREDLCNFLKNHNLKYGYATYWNAGIYTVMSDFETMIYPVTEEELEPYYWYVQKELYLPIQEKGDTFLMISRKQYKEWSDSVGFQLKYSNYKEKLEYSSYIILVYDYNIATEFESLKSSENQNILGTLSYSEGCYVEEKNVVVPENETMFGPYVSLMPGHYKLAIECRAKGDNQIIVRDMNAEKTLVVSTLEDGSNEYEFDLFERLEQVELYLLNTTGGDIAVKEVVLEQIYSYKEGDKVLINEQMLLNENSDFKNGKLIIEKDGVVFGPYWDMNAGNYTICIDTEMEESDEISLFITANEANTEILSMPLKKGENRIPFTLGVYENGVEFKVINLGSGTVSADIYFEMYETVENATIELDENDEEEED